MSARRRVALESGERPVRSRARRWTAALVLVLVVVGAGVLVQRWHGSVGHRADEITTSIRAMPGVASADLKPTDGDGPRDLRVRLSRSIDRPAARDVSRRLDRTVGGGVIDDVELRVGAVRLSMYDEGGVGDSSDAFDLALALRGLSGMTVTFDASDSPLRIDRGRTAPLPAAKAVLDALPRHWSEDRNLEFSAPDKRTAESRESAISNHSGTPVATLRRQIDRLMPVAASVEKFRIGGGYIELSSTSGTSSQLRRVFEAGQRAAASAGAESPSVQVSAPRAGDRDKTLVLTGKKGEDIESALSTVTQLRKKKVPVRSIDADRTHLVLGDEDSADPADLTAALAALRSLRPALPASADLSLGLSSSYGRSADPPPSGAIGVRGTPAQLSKIVRPLKRASSDGYNIRWSVDAVTTELVQLPAGTELDRAGARAAMSRVRSMPWPGTARISLVESPSARGRLPVPVGFRSTATGGTREVESGSFGKDSRLPLSELRSLWNATATSADRAAPR